MVYDMGELMTQHEGEGVLGSGQQDERGADEYPACPEADRP
jgi:hypothetical protein